MTDEAPRGLVPLQREVEPPRTGTGLWLPFMALASAAMLTIVSGIAVMTRAPRAVLVEPAPEVQSRRAEIEAQLIEARERMERNQQRVMCRAPVHRGNVDGEPQPYDECIVPRDIAPVTYSRPPEAR
jgi:hypothetical protein